MNNFNHNLVTWKKIQTPHIGAFRRCRKQVIGAGLGGMQTMISLMNAGRKAGAFDEQKLDVEKW